jgi:hypothetical protein
MTLATEFTGDPWPAERLREARAILADAAHHPDTLVSLAARVIVRHSRDEAECRDAHALRRLFKANLQSTAPTATCLQGGAA